MRLYISNFPYSTDEADIRELLAPYGPVERIRVRHDRDTGHPLGCAFATVRDGAGAIAELDGTQYGGRRLDVREANPPRRSLVGMTIPERIR
jgi:RNA recognition motif-containing protein